MDKKIQSIPECTYGHAFNSISLFCSRAWKGILTINDWQQFTRGSLSCSEGGEGIPKALNHPDEADDNHWGEGALGPCWQPCASPFPKEPLQLQGTLCGVSVWHFSFPLWSLSIAEPQRGASFPGLWQLGADWCAISSSDLYNKGLLLTIY